MKNAKEKPAISVPMKLNCKGVSTKLSKLSRVFCSGFEAFEKMSGSVRLETAGINEFESSIVSFEETSEFEEFEASCVLKSE